ncbi:hypothetical protein [Streptomyces sp. NPDC048606]|uniref:hypothetical protein n=1 Tax=Streptomyces sp. NPDC048606 TaxID=3154726 RepID=UPI00342FAC42
MFFSMKISQPMTPEEEAAHEAATMAFNEACDERDALPPGPPYDRHSTAANIRQHRAETIPGYLAADRKVHRAYWASTATDLTNLHIRITAMSYHVTVMHRLGMIMTDYERPPYPKQPSYLWFGPEQDAMKAENPEGLAAARAAHDESVEAHRLWSPQDVRGIPEHKLQYGVGEYFVTPEEIAAALAAYRLRSDDEVMAAIATVGKVEDAEEGEDLQVYPVGIGTGDWITWITYLERARRRGGFSVEGGDL